MIVSMWRWLTGGRTARLTSPGERNRPQLEIELRRYYTSTLDEGWKAGVEDRIHARVSHTIAAQRMASRTAGGIFHLKRVLGPQVAAVICAGAVVIAFGGMIDGGRGGSQAQVQPTSSPRTGQPARPNINAKLSLLPVQPPSSVARAV